MMKAWVGGMELGGYPDVNGNESAFANGVAPRLGDATALSNNGCVVKVANLKMSGKKRRVFERDRFRCVSCGSNQRLTLDHIVPVARGGSGEHGNLQTMCGPCNQAKGHRQSSSGG